MAESNMRVLEERVTRLKRDLAKAESAALALKDARRMAEEETRATKAQLKSTEKELRTARSDYLKLVDRLGVVCCDAGLRDLREGKSSYFPCAKCSTKLSASKAVSAEWVDGVGFADLVEDGPAAPAVFIAPRRRAVSISNSVPRSTNTARSSTPNRPSTPTRRALAGSPSPSPLRPVTPVSRTVSSVSRPASPTVKPKSTKPAAVAVQTKASVKDYSAAKDLKDKDTNPDFGSHAGSPSVQTPLSTISPSMSRSASPEPSIAASILSSTASTANMDSLAALLAQQTAVLTQHTTLLARLLGSSAEDPTISQPFSPVSPVTVDGEAIPPSTDASLHENDVGAPFTCESSRRASIASSNDVFADLDSIDEDFATSNDNHDSLVPSDFQVEPVSSSDRPEPSVLSRTEAASPDPVARASAAPVANSPDSAKTLVVYNPRSAAATSASTKSGKRLSQKVLHPTIRDLFVKVSGKARTFLDKRGGAMSVPPYSAAYPIVASVRGVAERRRG
ncbi:hypothetical protein HDU84_006040 [Entophlyctis sp. JEL0112]|nr:hypothetical protein HDU84_006040 [Entophlyctis sp. JEL0112]